MYMMMKMMTKLFVLVAFTLCCASCLYASEMPEVKKTPLCECFCDKFPLPQITLTD